MEETNYKVCFILSNKNQKNIIRDYNLNLIDKDNFKNEIYFTSPLDMKTYLEFYKKGDRVNFNDMLFYIEDISCNMTDGKINFDIKLLYFNTLEEDGSMYGEVWR